ncbi:hypothetical protein SPRG_02420 [Saprolegnia parasitica CBS 223.65]|uniref:Kinesin-like protein n=1 Tax=Saprolegnia parasitica (strain CBS 223.65) TaxID=695850 RepID=A0A067D128_SAPPC|nr:hypothetical protein SPRG_02420 [Saprolegnia parasitica CBS 223.65]KDO32722.1 hypothetical protein SPRG_02420 [Saprolegnia parasitica CBS 223.65]|eukprot:XP_012196386.1 hypothetical protein SPRG_02420 [Saprolegnia parasitica CBS 223.65]
MTSEDDPTSIPKSSYVAVRLRPISEKELQEGQRSCCHVANDQTVVIEKEAARVGYLKSQKGSSNEYAYDIAFSEEATQDEVYERTVKNIIPTILDGYNATIFAYGATGAGKTHTMMGSERDGHSLDELTENDFDDDGQPESLPVDGIIPQSLSDIFRLIRLREKEEKIVQETEGRASEWMVTVSYLEVYNETICDLIDPKGVNLQLREHTTIGAVHVSGLAHRQVRSAVEVLNILRQGNKNRRTESTVANAVSSRSHAVLQVTVKHKTVDLMRKSSPNTEMTCAKLSLIDLAGSERACKTENSGARLTEGANINKSLLALANAINALSSTPAMRRRRAKYRDSKLTHLLKSSLEGDCRLIMIANINPSHKSFDESHNTLKYANRAKNIKIRPKMHVVTAAMTHIQRAEKLEEENASLRRELAEVRTKRKSIDAAMFSSQHLADAKRAKLSLKAADAPQLHSLHRTIEKLENEKKALQDKVQDMERELSRMRTLRIQPTTPRQATTPRATSTPRQAMTPRSITKAPPSITKAPPSATKAPPSVTKSVATPAKSPSRNQAREAAPAKTARGGSLLPQRRLSSHPVVFRAATPTPATPARNVGRTRRESLIPRMSTSSKVL